MQPGLEGLDYLAARLRSLLDPAKMPPTPPQTDEPLRELMTEQLDTVLQQAANTIRPQIFLITRLQLQALEEMGADPEAIRFITSLNATGLDPLNYQINTRLRFLMGIPANGDWKTWWINQAVDHEGIHVKTGTDAPETAISQELTALVTAAARTALAHMPACIDIAREMAMGRGLPRTGREYAKPQKGTIKLGPVCVTRRMVEELAQRLLVDPSEVPEPDRRTPEEMLQELRQAGLRVEQDIGTVTSIEKLRNTIGSGCLDLVDINLHQRTWATKGIPYGNLISDRDIPGNRLGCKMDEENPILQELGPDETELIRMVVPAHPALNPRDNWTRNRNARALGFITMTPPDQVMAYMSGKSDDPVSRHLGVCPMAKICPTHCGKLQREGEFPFPINQDGRHTSCRYWRFLNEHRQMDREARERMAALNRQLALAELTRNAPGLEVRIVPGKNAGREQKPWEEYEYPEDFLPSGRSQASLI